MKTLCGKLNREQSENDATKTIEVFNAMRAEDPEFKYSVQVDDEGRVKTLMWTIGRSIEQFKCFGDAVTFDTMYKTNLYEMPFGLFVGVNNHFQRIIFGGVLMSDKNRHFQVDIHRLLSDDRCTTAADDHNRPGSSDRSCHSRCHAIDNTSLVQMACAQASEGVPWNTPRQG